MEVTVVNDSHATGWLASAVRESELYMSDAASMVRNVLAALVPYRRVCAPGQTLRKMSRLNILDHGTANTIRFGSDRVNTGNLAQFKPTLSRLRGHFTNGGFVHLQHCDVGRNRPLMLGLAKIFGVPVYGGTGGHNPLYRFNWGDYVRANPSGTFEVDVDRP